ncbi:DUF5667 domain-containing protein [Desulfosporosinus sp. FKB]|uniref:DUF5667 domain-containing protein n=1 Tax=Desulfosporosinus sp. FKB TaxID=1969835 RepID=UPI000B49EDE3|nr:DUF5667 domain-containing protein [Desulfosporosinus sp. FKB]
MNKMQHMKRRIAIAATFTLLTLPIGSALTLADTVSSASSATDTTATTTTPTTPTTSASTTATTTGTTTAAPPLDPTVPVTVSPATVVDGNGNTVTAENWFTDLLGKIQLMLTSDPVNKASINEHHALANLAEAKNLMQQGDPEAAEASLSQYSDKISQAQNFINQAKDPNSETAKALSIALANVNSNNIAVLSSLLDKLPPQAAQRLALNIVETMEKDVTKLQAEGTDSTASTTSSTTVASGTSASTSGSVADSGSVTANSSPTNTQPTTNNNKQLEKDAKVALENFKKSLKQNVKLNLDDQDQDEDNSGAQQVTSAQQTPMTQGTTMSGLKASSNSVHPSVKGSTNSEHGSMAKSKRGGRENHQRD